MQALKRIWKSLLLFFNSEIAGGVLLFLCAVLAMIIANSPISSYYFDFWRLNFGITIGDNFFWHELTSLVK